MGLMVKKTEHWEKACKNCPERCVEIVTMNDDRGAKEQVSENVEGEKTSKIKKKLCGGNEREASIPEVT